MYEIIESVKNVVRSSKYIEIDYKNIDKYLYLFDKPQSSTSILQEYMDMGNLSNEEIARFCLILQSIDFCFWQEPKWIVSYKDKNFSGFYAVIIVLVRALEEGFNILNFDYLRTISEIDFKHIMRGTAIIPLFNKRLEIVQNVAKIVLEKLDGKLYDYFLQANSDQELLTLIVDIFPDFSDVSIINSQEVYFFKRATLLVYDLYSYLPNIKNNIRNIDKLVAGADYKLPQVLRELGILNYNEELQKVVDNKIPILHNTLMEIEIRANTVYVIDIIKNKLKEQGIQMTSFELGTLIWLLSKREEYQKKPYHLCENIWY